MNDRLADHLAGRYGIQVTGLTTLDREVFRADRADGDPWVARVFPADRPLSEVEGGVRPDLRDRGGTRAVRRSARPGVPQHRRDGKLWAEAMEETDPGPRDALRVAGASGAQITTNAVLPTVLPQMAGLRRRLA